MSIPLCLFQDAKEKALTTSVHIWQNLCTLAQAVDSPLPAQHKSPFSQFPWKPAIQMEMLMVGYSRGRTHCLETWPPPEEAIGV